MLVATAVPIGKRFRRATAPVSATPIGTLTETRARSVLLLLVAILESTDKAVDLVRQAHVHRALRTARPAHPAAAAILVRRVGMELEVEIHVILVQQGTTYQLEATACPALLTVAARQVRVCVRAMQG